LYTVIKSLWGKQYKKVLEVQTLIMGGSKLRRNFETYLIRLNL
jgi:hypothetical protein